METPVIIDPNRIEKELSDLMAKASPAEARASLLNLVVFTGDGRAEQANALLESVLGKRAARVIHIKRGSAAESSVSVSARCYLDAGKRSVCLQEVIIENGRDGAGADPSTWAPMLVRDIPVSVVWLDRIVGTDFAPLLDLADTVILDSEASLRAGEPERELFGALQTLGTSVTICDFSWRRVLPLCEITAETFDTPILLERVDEVDAVSLTGAPRAFALLYTGWFASRLGWQPARPRGIETEHDSAEWLLESASGRSIRVAHRKPAPLSSGAEVTIGFDGYDDLRVRLASGGCAEVTDGCDETVRVLDLPNDGAILLAEIDGAHRDHIYAETVARIDSFIKLRYALN